MNHQDLIAKTRDDSRIASSINSQWSVYRKGARDGICVLNAMIRW